ncbi:MAG TPA: GvpL/GvpF family gas vesicle protein [Chloroflexota bacterium]|nr:GvpL/GvpF family gas vesicle protein [Chloroflexota bacterium]
MSRVDSLLYLYGVAPASAVGAVDGLAGIDGGVVRALTEGDLTAITSDVPAADFDEAPLNAHLSDLEWLAPRAERHQLVNGSVFERTDALLPLSFGTVFRTEESLRRMLRDRQADLLAGLAAVRGCSEWVVTIRRDTPRAEAAVDAADESVAQLRREVGSSAPGRRYLLERQMADLRRRALRAADAAAVEETVAAIEAGARRTFREPIVTTRADASQAVGRVSALVERVAESRFCDSLDRLQIRWEPRGYGLERTGPWPPYRFGRGDGA